MDKKVSILMSTYNEPIEWLEESITSILSQTYSNLEIIIIVDNPDNIDMIEYIKQISRKKTHVKVIINKENIGLVGSLNKGIKVATGFYIARMDADDISESNRIERQVDYLERKNLDFVFSGLRIINEDSKELYNTDLDEITEKKVASILKVTNISNHPTWLLKKDIYHVLGGYREVLYTEDYDFSLRALEKGYKIGKMPGYTLKYRIRETSVSRSYSLIQYLNSKVLITANNLSKISSDSFVFSMLEEAKKMATEKETEKFKMAEICFLNGISEIKQKKILTGVKNLWQSLLGSKYFREKTFQVIKYKVKKI